MEGSSVREMGGVVVLLPVDLEGELGVLVAGLESFVERFE